MKSYTKPLLYFVTAALLATAATLSWLFSPMLIWSFFCGFFTDNCISWRWELLPPQIERVPLEAYLVGSLALNVVALTPAWVAYHFESVKLRWPLIGYGVGFIYGVVYWALSPHSLLR